MSTKKQKSPTSACPASRRKGKACLPASSYPAPSPFRLVCWGRGSRLVIGPGAGTSATARENWRRLLGKDPPLLPPDSPSLSRHKFLALAPECCGTTGIRRYCVSLGKRGTYCVDDRGRETWVMHPHISRWSCNRAIGNVAIGPRSQCFLPDLGPIGGAVSDQQGPP